MARYFLILSYNGSSFNGWQVQDNTTNTVQQVLEEKLSMILKEKVELMGCGRTDAGVNAKNFVAHFDSQHADLVNQKAHWLYKFNTILPPTISIHDIKAVTDRAHARFDATQRVYYYFLSNQKNPFRDSFTYPFYGELDFELMNQAAETLLHFTDFTSFSKVHTQTKTNNCKITKAIWQKSGENEWRFTISADRFLRGMVRAIVGTLILVGRNKISIQEFKTIVEAKNRKAAGSNVPANALFLSGINYPKDIYIG